MREPAAALLGEPVLAAAPVSPVPRRAPGRGAWGHEPLTGAQVRLLAVTAERVAVLTLDRDVGGPHLYRPLLVEVDAPRSEVRGVHVGRLRPARRLTVLLRGGEAWRLEVSASGRRTWGLVVEELGRLGDEVVEGAVVSPDSAA